MVNLKQYIEPTDVTFEWIINQLDGKDKKLDKIRKQNRVSGIGYQLIEGTGFLSYVGWFYRIFAQISFQLE